MKAAEADFLGAASRYAALRKDTLARVARWEWSSSLPRYDLQPLAFLNDTSRRGKASRTVPKKRENKHEYGFDEAGRVIAQRQHTEFADEYYEEFLEYTPDLIRSTYYHHGRDKKPINCARLSRINGVPSAFHRQATGGSSSEVYIIEGGHVRYNAWLARPGHRAPWGACGEVLFKPDNTVELWQFPSAGSPILVFAGDASLYDTMQIGRGA